MLDQLQQLKTRLETENEAPITQDENDFLSGIRTVDDLRRPYENGSIIQAVAHDAAIALGLSPIEAKMITGESDPASLTKITLHYQEGEYLSAYTVHGEGAELLKKIGLARYVDGWGVKVFDGLEKALGTEFLYHQAIEFAQPMLNEKREREAFAKYCRDSKFAEAAGTGKPVILNE